MLTLDTFNAFVKRLACTDWYYEYTDDGNVYRARKALMDKLREDAATNSHLKAAFDVWQQYAYKGDHVVTAQVIRDAQIEEIRSEITATA